MLMILHSAFSLSITEMFGLGWGVLFPDLSGLKSSKAFYISHSLALAVFDERTTFLHIQFQIYCTGATTLFFKLVVSLPVLIFS